MKKSARIRHPAMVAEKFAAALRCQEAQRGAWRWAFLVDARRDERGKLPSQAIVLEGGTGAQSTSVASGGSGAQGGGAMQWQTFLVATVLVAVPVSAEPAEPLDHPEYAVVKQVIEDSIGWALTKDLNRLLTIFAEADLQLWWVNSSGGASGTADLRKTAETVWMTPDFKATRCEFRDVRIRFSRDGSVAWFSCTFDDCGVFKGEGFCLENVRKTGVLEKRGEQWTIVQSHASWPVDRIPEETWQRLVERRKAGAARPR